MSALTLLTGGARSGKSSIALRAAEATGLPIVFVATGWADDAEMEERIARHRAERPPHWRTVEERRDLAGALRALPADCCAVVDCLSLWVANLLGDGLGEDDVARLADEAASVAAGRPSPVIAVTNEVGLGVVPATPTGRLYRDLLGRANASWARAARHAVLVVAGRTVPLAGAGWLIEEHRP